MLADRLRARIRADGPMPFEEFMAACLYDEDFGFFATGPLRSVKSGDFLTSPEVSPWFGRMLARFVVGEQERTAADPFLVAEVAAGSGSLLRPLIEALSSSLSGGGAERSEAEAVKKIHRESSNPPPGLAAGLPPEGGEEERRRSTGASSPLPPPQGEVSATKEPTEGVRGIPTPIDATLTHVPPAEGRGDMEERSEDAGGQHSSLSHGVVEMPGRAEGADGESTAHEFHAIEASPAAREALTDLLDPAHIHASLDDLPDHFNGIIIANELFDNIRCALAIRSGDGWVERWVGATDDRFGFVTATARTEVIEWCDAYAGAVPEGGLVEVQLAATEWIEEALSHIERGALVAIDYGGTAEELEPRRTQGTLRTYRSHHLGPDPLLEPGETDVTVDVNFTAMIAAAESSGAAVELHRQDDFLTSLGLRDVVRDLRHRERQLARSGDAMERLMVRSEATDAQTLLHPRGLGDFRVLVARRG